MPSARPASTRSVPILRAMHGLNSLAPQVLVAWGKFEYGSEGGKGLWMVQFVCSKLSGEYCYPKVGDVFEAFMDAEV